MYNKKLKFPFSNSRPVICAIMKLESPYILEWVAWHRLQGFDIIIADNCTEGMQTRILKKLENFGLIHYMYYGDVKVCPQMKSYHAMFWKAFSLGYKYIGFLDADEFFEPISEDFFCGAKVVRDSLKKPFVWAVSYRWAVFGSNNLVNYSDELVLERFARRGKSECECSQAVKSFARISAVLMKIFFSSVHKAMSSPHVFRLWKFAYSHDGVRNKIRDDHATPHNWNNARIRHYAVKSWEEFLIKKNQRGDSFAKNGKKNIAYWDMYNKNDEYDPIDINLLSEVKDELNRMRVLINE